MLERGFPATGYVALRGEGGIFAVRRIVRRRRSLALVIGPLWVVQLERWRITGPGSSGSVAGGASQDAEPATRRETASAADQDAASPLPPIQDHRHHAGRQACPLHAEMWVIECAAGRVRRRCVGRFSCGRNRPRYGRVPDRSRRAADPLPRPCAPPITRCSDSAPARSAPE